MHKVVVWFQSVLIPFLGPFGFFLTAFLDSSFLSIPEINDFLIVTSSAARPGLAWLYVGMTTLGSVAGCLVLREVGVRGGELRFERRFGKERVAAVRESFERWGVLTLAIPALLPPPMPFKVFVLASGVFGFPYPRFALTLLLARSARYTFWGAMGVVYGVEARALLLAIDAWCAERFPLLLGFLAALLLVVLLMARRRRARAAVEVDGAA